MKRIISFLLLLTQIVSCNPRTSERQELVDPPLLPVADTSSPVGINAPLIESPALVKIRFLNERDGWGVTETQIVRTNDGGITWYNVTPNEITETGYSVDWFVLDNNNVWIQQPDFANFPFGGFQYHTSDGGMNWSKTEVPYSGAKISFLEANNGWALADLGVGAGSNAVAVYQTSDAGATWNMNFINDPNQASASDSLPLGGLKFGLTPLDMQTAWIFGVVYAPGTPYLFRTDDGGRTWSPVQLPLPPGAENAEVGIEQMAFTSDHDAYILMRALSEASNLVLYVSNDGGNTWAITPTLIPGGGFADFLPAGGIVLYNRAQFYVTRDSARTWSIIPPDIAFGEIFAGMDFLTASTGYVITQDPTNHRSLYRTDDGGATWLPVIP
ncbi:MAG: YCF48-related protein [Chloroflexota bacterium]